jgi:methanogenic corrinoid protein MtbC1
MQKLLETAAKLAPVTREAAEAYDARKGLLAERVNQSLLARADLAEIIGSTDATELMQDNHRNHAMFLTTVLHLNAFRLLASVIPWVYRTYHQHGFSFSYFPIALNAWKQAVEKELPPAAAADIVPVYDWMLTEHQNVTDLVSSLTVGKDGAMTAKAEGFLDSMLKQDLSDAIDLGEKNLNPGTSLRLFYRDTIRPAMYEVGARWSRGEISVAEEHMATALAQTVVANLQARSPASSGKRGRAIITAATNEQHELGARMVAHAFETDNWEVIYLGANMPLSDLTHMARRISPRFIGISLAMPYHLHHVKRIIDTFKSDTALAQIKIIVGGLVFAVFPEAAACLPGALIVSDLEEALDLARRWAVG